jgi:two-component system, OmpR family, phosphate regulon sensor histidine kinase PhoR
MFSDQLPTSIKLALRKFRLARGLIYRGLLCWTIGLVLLTNDEVTSYDSRMQLRGPQIASSKIILITLKPSDLADLYRFKNRFGRIGDITEITDAYYWDPKVWEKLLGKVLAFQPKKIGVTLFFHQNLGPLRISPKAQELFQDPRIVWGATPLSRERYSSPLLANELSSNIGSLELVRDEDGFIRRFVSRPGEVPHIVQQMNSIIPYILTQQEPVSQFINYRGGSGTFIEYSLRDVLENRLPPEALTDKYILIGSESSSNVQYLTPLGALKRHEVLAQILDNVLEKRWIYRASNFAYALVLVAFLAIAIALILAYPQSIALVLIFWLATLNLALSAWIFDTFYVWFPAISSSVMLAATWVVFIGYQAHQMERKNWQLQKDQEYLAALEQLKNNFVSLISHDLKTPIAKIQAIAERLLAQQMENSALTGDLNSLRTSAEELNRYVQSVLKVLRVESKNFELQKEVGDINEAIEQAKSQLSPLAQDKNIQIVSQLEPLFSIEVDFTLIREVLVNLIENAIKYSTPGGTITLSSREMNNKVWIEVDDNGPGIAPEDIGNVWGKFVRGKDQDLNTKGSGLGLYLVKYFIELHGGEVFLKSELKKGTKVSFSLPLEENEKDWI